MQRVINMVKYLYKILGYLLLYIFVMLFFVLLLLDLSMDGVNLVYDYGQYQMGISPAVEHAVHQYVRTMRYSKWV